MIMGWFPIAKEPSRISVLSMVSQHQFKTLMGLRCFLACRSKTDSAGLASLYIFAGALSTGPFESSILDSDCPGLQSPGLPGALLEFDIEQDP